MDLRYDWTRSEIRQIHDLPLLELVFRAQTIHRRHHDPRQMQVCRLVSIKTGGCVEDCKYCAQSSRYGTEVKPEALMDREQVVEIARKARDAGLTRICMGAAWREVRDSRQFDRVLEMVRDVTGLGLEVCCTLGMLNDEQARRLEAAGLYAYNHNIDTSEEFYETIITTRQFADRLRTIETVRKTGMTVCTGGIIGMGESIDDRVSMLHTLATMRPHPESVPINVLSKVPGTPLADVADVPIWDTVRMIATARIVMPDSVVRLSAGRDRLSPAEQTLCFMAGANSFFSSDENKMLTSAVPCADYEADKSLLEALGLTIRPPFQSAGADVHASPLSVRAPAIEASAVGVSSVQAPAA